MTTEAAVTKLSFLLGNLADPKSHDHQAVKYLMTKNLRGELSRNMKPFYTEGDPSMTPSEFNKNKTPKAAL
jgi:hypothetical protein